MSLGDLPCPQRSMLEALRKSRQPCARSLRVTAWITLHFCMAWRYWALQETQGLKSLLQVMAEPKKTLARTMI
eukprot:4538884-Amphidinium_carterae.1